ncbi:membrane protein [Vibrio galatheae]|uniref:Membrane protein n=1 Tax=Vibrio galatheae TaxID=579748 RepID=A0A0F4NPN0_9VIBR|nr:porin [Vibrio galatheae]KJY84036.1 membrane protein [Vibrio galatheae]
MKKTILAVAIASVSASSVAVELYNNDGTTFSMGGHVSVNVNGSEQGDTDVGSNSPRINFTATQDLGNGVVVDARGEWAINYLDGGDDTFTTRLGYVGLTHETAGRAVIGTQWAPYYDVAGATDMPIAFANDFLYDNHGALGTGRADKMVSYRNGFDFASAGEFNFGLGWQGANDKTTEENSVVSGVDYDDRLQVALTYSIAGVTLGYTHNTGDFSEGGAKDTAKSDLVSVAYGSYGKGLYLAGIYAANENMNAGLRSGVTLQESDAYELLAAYALENSLNFSINYEVVEGKEFKASSAEETAREEMALQVEYNFAPNFVGFAGYQFDLNDANDRSTDDKWTIGGRYYL